jgi:hypothetical protein
MKPGDQCAFPQPLVDNAGRIDSAVAHGEGGMTLREYAAAKAMQGMLAATDPYGVVDLRHVASGAVKAADALLEELAKA